MEVCKNKHRYDEKFKTLSNSQAGEGRHLCCGCAYDLGVKDALSGNEKHFDPTKIKFSQAGEIRHKNAKEAYELGYNNNKR